jgi:PKD repeat protein
VETPRLRGQALAPAGPSASETASDPQMLIVGTYSGGDVLQQLLGGTPTRSATLPEDLTPYKVIWYMHYASLMSTEERARLVAFVQGGGGLYLSGEGSCCESVNLSIKAIVAAVVKNSANIQVGGLGDVQPIGQYYITPNTEIASLPTSLGPGTSWNTVSAGGMLNVPAQNQFITADVFNTTVAAVWDGPSLVGGYGRLVVLLDGNWVLPTFFNTESAAILGNITRFLLNAPEPNLPPTAGIVFFYLSGGGGLSGSEGSRFIISSAGSEDPEHEELTFAWDLDNDGEFDDSAAPNPIKTIDDNGSYTFHLRVTDKAGATAEASRTLEIYNREPTMGFSAPASVVEGSAITLVASDLNDALGDLPSLAVTYSCDGGTTFKATASCAAVDGPATVNVVGRVTDKDGGYTDYSKSVSVTNASPTIASLTLPAAPVPVGTSVSLAATFSDAWMNDGHTASIEWDDASSSAAVSVSTPGSVAATHSYSTPGVYTVTLTVKDDADAEDVEEYQYVVVYDPSAGFVTGGGWIAYGSTACPILCGGTAGRADFGFVSKYKKGATVPTGDTRFEFHAGTLSFASTEYEWLTVAGKRAQFKGRGTINGAGDYGFVLTAIDDATDAFRIKIWSRSTNVVVFDNKMNSSDDSSDATLLDKVTGGGSIVIHAK